MTGNTRNPPDPVDGNTFEDHLARSVEALAKAEHLREKINIFNDFLRRFNAGEFDEREPSDA